jgi:hypothetical protein
VEYLPDSKLYIVLNSLSYLDLISTPYFISFRLGYDICMVELSLNSLIQTYGRNCIEELIFSASTPFEYSYYYLSELCSVDLVIIADRCQHYCRLLVGDATALEVRLKRA